MTSFSRKLYNRDPGAAEAFHRAQQFDHRIVYGKSTTLACFMHMAEPGEGLEYRKVFGQRATPPQQPAYEVWGTMGKSKVVIFASNSFEARKEFAAHHKIEISETMARLMQGAPRLEQAASLKAARSGGSR